MSFFGWTECKSACDLTINLQQLPHNLPGRDRMRPMELVVDGVLEVQAEGVIDGGLDAHGVDLVGLGKRALAIRFAQDLAAAGEQAEEQSPQWSRPALAHSVSAASLASGGRQPPDTSQRVHPLSIHALITAAKFSPRPV